MREYKFVGETEIDEIANLLELEDSTVRLIYGIEQNKNGWDAVSYVVYSGHIIFGSSKNVNPPSGMSAFVLDSTHPVFEKSDIISTLHVMEFCMMAEGATINLFLNDCQELDKARPSATCYWFFRKYTDLLEHTLSQYRGE
jgi:hypothetical protein